MIGINNLNTILVDARISEIKYYQDFMITLNLKDNQYGLFFLQFTMLSDWYIQGSEEWNSFVPPIHYKSEFDDAKKAYFLMHLAHDSSIVNVIVKNDYSLSIEFNNGWKLIVPSHSEYFELAWVFDNNIKPNDFYLAYHVEDKILLTTRYW